MPDYEFRNRRKNERKAVTWEPFTAQHAIERVRIVLHFTQAIQPKQVSSLAALVEAKRAELELGPQTSTNTNVVELDASTGEARISKQPSGWSFSKTTSEGAPVEAVLLNPQFLLYEAATYDHWEDFWPRYNAITSDLRARIQSDINVRAVALEYLDRFRFEGDIGAAEPGLLVRDPIVGSLPDSVRSGRELWHVHRGWFEGEEPRRYLVNQNFDAQSVQDPEGAEVRSIALATKVERQSATGDLDISSLPDDIDIMHTLSKRVVRETLSDDMCKRVGLAE
ncbi:MAG: TIGR04255 family protein [Amaricoccus sp.]